MIKKIIFTILTISWMILIFGMSNETAGTSGGRSEAVSKFVCEHFISSYDTMSVDARQNMVKKLEHVIRKCAHMTEYAILGVLLCVTIASYGIRKRCALLSFVIGFLYACSDEFHQLFIAGRSGRFTDVLIDSIGLGIGIFITVVLLHVGTGRNNSKKELS